MQCSWPKKIHYVRLFNVSTCEYLKHSFLCVCVGGGGGVKYRKVSLTWLKLMAQCHIQMRSHFWLFGPELFLCFLSLENKQLHFFLLFYFFIIFFYNSYSFTLHLTNLSCAVCLIYLACYNENQFQCSCPWSKFFF